MKHGTLIFLHRPDTQEILLAMKKRGFGEGKWNGVGGKVENTETIEEAAMREANEEIKVRINAEDLNKVAEIDFVFKDKPTFNQYVHVFFVRKWAGDAQETEEMRPNWFQYKNVPYEEMWIDDKYWLPKVIEGNRLFAQFVFDNLGNELLEIRVEEKQF